ncbi:Secreted thaumatin-like protein cetA [Penicillium diatomitis]|uniref:Secreted thaumatin-like protein cetA n=1 Tax=Penicillium diatomitis TaxID=2819901 RepID=A0A9W9XHD4_9EURO|nr:Secreted thaumatin-like protein cetA [Penicillium diatomitis]KAJ5493007.1 Secreted thaumatin-like protein cetA [Penicillium diatomitis]
MMFTKTFGFAAAFAALASALPNNLANMVRRDNTATGGSVLITNNLSVDVYAWSVTDVSGPMITLPANGGVYTEAWQTNPNGGGVSIKLSTDPNQQDVLQFEYTQAVDTIFWDLSCINMGSNSQFTKYGFAVLPTESSSSCPSAICAAGDSACSDAYLIPTDDYATHGCPINTGLSLTIGQ